MPLATTRRTSTILHGAADTLASAGSTTVVTAVAPILGVALQGPMSAVTSVTQTPVTMLAPHTGPASTDLLSAVGQGNVTAAGQATGVVVTRRRHDIAQSTILHGVANSVTAATDSFHFPAASGGGADALSGVLADGATGAHPFASAGTPAAVHAEATHVDLPIEHPLDALAHAAHHA